MYHEEEGAFAAGYPVYKVDENIACDIKSKINVNIKSGKWIRWEIYSGTGALGSDLIEYMKGSRVVFKYYPQDENVRETVFLIKGMHVAIKEMVYRRPCGGSRPSVESKRGK